jgi:lipopolysaccharide transport system permease protein
MELPSSVTEPPAHHGRAAANGKPPHEVHGEPPAAAGAPRSDELPVTVIDRRRGWGLADVRELWRYRELLFFLTWRDIMVRYKQTVLGALWAVLQPLAIMLVFSLFFARVAGDQNAAVDYRLFVFAGLLPWTFFANAITSSSGSIVGSTNLVTKVYFPRLLIPMGAVAAGLVDFAIAFGMLLVLMALFGVAPGWGMLWLPLLVGTLVLAAFGVGAMLSALTVAYRDFRFVVPFLVQLWMFATPCIYLQNNAYLQDETMGAWWRTLLPLNPAYGLVGNFRQAVLGGNLDFYSLAVSGLVSVALLVLGCGYFRRVERGFADII